MSRPESKQPKVLVVEDEKSIRDGLADVLRFRGYDVTTADDGIAALVCAQSASFDLVLLDVMMPELDGYSVCERLRQQGNEVGVLMLTAKGSEEDILRGFEAGADDYVTKPFGLKELLARVQAMLRRTLPRGGARFSAGPLTVDADRGTAEHRGAKVELTPREITILRLLSADPGRILSRRTLLRDAWGMNHVEHVETRTVDMHIAKLRKKLNEIGVGSLETVRGQGYRWQGFQQSDA